MDIGMLWLDDDAKRPFDEKIKRAAEYYRNKYGRKPNLCLVHQKSANETTVVGKINVIPDPSISLHHFWIGLKSV